MSKPPAGQPAPEARSKRLTIDVSLDLHRRIKTASAHQGALMADTLRAVLEREFPPLRDGITRPARGS